MFTKVCKKVKKVKKANLYSALYISSLSLKRSDMARVQQGDHTVLPATHTRTIPVWYLILIVILKTSTCGLVLVLIENRLEGFI